MNNQVPKYVTCGRAALLLGIPEDELSRISDPVGTRAYRERRRRDRDVFYVRRVAADLFDFDAPGELTTLDQRKTSFLRPPSAVSPQPRISSPQEIRGFPFGREIERRRTTIDRQLMRDWEWSGLA